MIRNSLDYANYKDRKVLAQVLRPICNVAGEQEAEHVLQDFADAPWGEKLPMIAQSWRRAWEHVAPFFVFPPEIRRVDLHHECHRKPEYTVAQDLQNPRALPSNEAAVKLLWLALRNVLAKSVRTLTESPP
uniref:Mutator family transposase n=1 Tax=Cupriavidus taiwanensis TaxID=164546 RepID=A0A375HEM6_9BURK